MKLVIAAICASAFASSANGAVTCSEAIASVILHANGNVYFRTDKTCNTVWCTFFKPDPAKHGLATNMDYFHAQ